MAIQYVSVKDGAGGTVPMGVSDSPGGSNRFNASVPIVGTTEVSPSNPMPVRGGLVFVSNEFTRPSNATAYSVGDVVCNSISAPALLAISGCARENGGTGFIVSAAVACDLKSITPSFRVHIFNLSTASIANDNDPHKELYADVAKKLGAFVIGPLWTPADTTNSTVSRASDMNLRVPFKCDAASTSLFFILEALTAFTPSSGNKITLTLGIDQN